MQNAMCRSLTKDRKCMFFNGVQKRRRDDACLEQSGRVHDIEDLVSLGRQEIFCPFFLERDAQLTADIVFVPYNYLVDPDIRKTLQLNLKHNIVIIDEAHNIAGMMTSVASFDISSTHLANCIGEVSPQALWGAGRVALINSAPVRGVGPQTTPSPLDPSTPLSGTLGGGGGAIKAK